MTNYYKLYKLVLATVNDSSPESGQQLIDVLSNDEYIVQERMHNPNLMRDLLLTLDNLIVDGLINGKKTSTKGITLYRLSGLTTEGQNYLLQVSDDSTSVKLKTFIKDNGVPMTPQNITRCIAQLFFK